MKWLEFKDVQLYSTNFNIKKPTPDIGSVYRTRILYGVKAGSWQGHGTALLNVSILWLFLLIYFFTNSLSSLKSKDIFNFSIYSNKYKFILYFIQETFKVKFICFEGMRNWKQFSLYSISIIKIRCLLYSQHSPEYWLDSRRPYWLQLGYPFS